ncbi:MAG: hypothetical protein NT004_06030 [Bacteroidetes bacterium]|nr:hypothetical protein [Bacteroidota bacterium]
MKTKKNKTEKEKASAKKLVEKAGLAIKHEFYLEASWLLSSILERKIGKIREKLEPQDRGYVLTFEQSIRRLKQLHVSLAFPELNANLELTLIDQIRNWKNKRNQVLKTLAEGNVTNDRLERLAKEGIQLYKELNKAAKPLKSQYILSDGDGEGESRR